MLPHCNIKLPVFTYAFATRFVITLYYPLWSHICLHVMWLTPQFSWSVCFCVHIYVGPPAGPCTLLLFGRGCDRPTPFVTGEFLLCLSIHQTAAYALFLWGIWERETVIVSVASSMYYIMARFFVGWCNLNTMHKIPLPPFIQWPCLKLSHLRQN